MSERSSFRLNGVQKGSRIAMCLDKYGRWDGGHKMGTLMRQTRHNVWILWDNDPDFEVWSQGDARYEVERGRWRISSPSRLNPLEAIAGVSKSSPSPGAPALTSPNGHGMMEASANRRQIEGGKMAESTTLSAKQVATKLGTDAKTFRRFLRSSSCSVEPVGQGGRYEFSSKDVEKLKSQFVSWRKPGHNNVASKPSTTKTRTKTEKTEAPKKKKHTIDDDPPEVRFNSTIAERQLGAAMANDVEKKLGLDDPDEEPTEADLEMEETLSDLAVELEDLDLDDLE